MSGATPDCGPVQMPPIEIEGEFPLPAVATMQFDHNSSGAPSIHAIHAGRTCRAAAHGKRRVNSATSPTGNVSKPKLVTTPKLPPPPPRHAQKRSSFSRRARAHEAAVGGHDGYLGDGVARESVSAPDHTDAAAEREPGDADGRARTARESTLPARSGSSRRR